MIMLIALPTMAFAMALLVLEAPPRIAPQQPTEQLPDETWSISGRVTDRETGQPLPRARVGVYSGRADLRVAPLRATRSTSFSPWRGLAPGTSATPALRP